jgi:hypothetical protein
MYEAHSGIICCQSQPEALYAITVLKTVFRQNRFFRFFFRGLLIRIKGTIGKPLYGVG